MPSINSALGMAGKRSLYAAAKTTRSTGGWSPVDSSINDLIGNSSPSVRARVRQLVRDFPYFARAVKVIADYVVGDGVTMQSRVTDTSGKINSKQCQQIEDAWSWWMEEADISGRLHYHEIEYLSKRQDAECGEFLLVRSSLKDSKRFLPFCLQMYEADWLTSSGAKPATKANNVDQGVEYNSTTGQIIAYHFADPDSFGKPHRIKAEQIIHGFETLRPGQLRGISPFTSGVIVTNDLKDIMDAEIDGAKMAAKWLAFITSSDPMMRQAAQVSGQLGDNGLPIEELENGIVEYLRPGESIELSSNPRPSQNFPPFVKLILGMLSVSTNVPYELLSGDYAGLNWAVSRVVRNDFAHSLRPVATRHIRHFSSPVFKSFMDSAVLSGRLQLPGYFNNPRPWLKNEWQPPGMEPVDPLRETKSNMEEIDNGLRSPQEVAAKRGRDLEDIYKEIAAARELAADNGLNFEEEETSTALANNPAALDGEKKK